LHKLLKEIGVTSEGNPLCFHFLTFDFELYDLWIMRSRIACHNEGIGFLTGDCALFLAKVALLSHWFQTA
jgi:hypothetical protein